jgi:hypothetical protein
MADQIAPLDSKRADEVVSLRAELAQRDEEILRLRDLLIVRDAELGAAKGRLAMIEQGSQRLVEAVELIPIPGISGLLKALARAIQRRLR